MCNSVKLPRRACVHVGHVARRTTQVRWKKSLFFYSPLSHTHVRANRTSASTLSHTYTYAFTHTHACIRNIWFLCTVPIIRVEKRSADRNDRITREHWRSRRDDEDDRHNSCAAGTRDAHSERSPAERTRRRRSVVGRSPRFRVPTRALQRRRCHAIENKSPIENTR